MAIQIILFILLVPVLVGYWFSATMFFKGRFDVSFYRLLQIIDDIKRLRFLPGIIMHEIKTRREIVRTEKYFATQAKDDVAAMKRGNTEAIARRLQVTEHTRTHLDPWNMTAKRPPTWIRYIIAQIVRW